MVPGGLCPGRELSMEVDGVKGPSCSASIIYLSHSPPLGACAPTLDVGFAFAGAVSTFERQDCRVVNKAPTDF